MARSRVVEVVGLAEIQRKFKDGGVQLWGPPVKEALEAAGRLGVQAARGTAPKGQTLQLSSKLTYKLSRAMPPRWVVIKTDAVRQAPAGGRRSIGARWKYPYPYPRRLEFDPKSPHKDWLLKAIKSVQGGLNRILSDAARSIEQRWER